MKTHGCSNHGQWNKDRVMLYTRSQYSSASAMNYPVLQTALLMSLYSSVIVMPALQPHLLPSSKRLLICQIISPV